jgi:hypothetical protein
MASGVIDPGVIHIDYAYGWMLTLEHLDTEFNELHSLAHGIMLARSDAFHLERRLVLTSGPAMRPIMTAIRADKKTVRRLLVEWILRGREEPPDHPADWWRTWEPSADSSGPSTPWDRIVWREPLSGKEIEVVPAEPPPYLKLRIVEKQIVPGILNRESSVTLLLDDDCEPGLFTSIADYPGMPHLPIAGVIDTGDGSFPFVNGVPFSFRFTAAANLWTVTLGPYPPLPINIQLPKLAMTAHLAFAEGETNAGPIQVGDTRRIVVTAVDGTAGPITGTYHVGQPIPGGISGPPTPLGQSVTHTFRQAVHINPDGEPVITCDRAVASAEGYKDAQAPIPWHSSSQCAGA